MKKNKGFDISDYKMCLYCLNSNELSDENIVICKKHGLKTFDDCCKNFELDLLSVTPKKLRNIKTSFTEDDFKL